MSTTELNVYYGALRDQFGKPTKPKHHTLKRNQDVLCDHFGAGKLWDLKVELGQTKVVMDVPDPETNEKRIIWVPLNMIQPRNAFESEYEVQRFLTMMSNKHQALPAMDAASNMGMGKGTGASSLRTPPTRGGGKGRQGSPPPPPDRNTRQDTRRTEKEVPPEEQGGVGGDDATGTAEEPSPAATEGGERSHTSQETCAELQSIARDLRSYLEGRMNHLHTSVRRDLRQELRTGPPRITKMGSKARAEASKKARKAKGLSLDAATICNLDVRAMRYMLQPFISEMVEASEEIMRKKITPDNLQLNQESILKSAFVAIKAHEPSKEDLAELVDGGKFRVLREAINMIFRDLRARYFNKLQEGFKTVTIADALNKGELHTVDTMYTTFTSQGVTAMMDYGVNNRRSSPGFSEPYRIPAFSQYLPAWAEMTETRNISSGQKSSMPFAGGPIIDGLIRVTCSGDDLPPFNFVCVVVAYLTAKEHGINLNHGFDLRLAAIDWKNWCAPASHTTAQPSIPSHPIPSHPTYPLSCPVHHVISLTDVCVPTGSSSPRRARKE
jgi:hypothetical protein